MWDREERRDTWYRNFTQGLIPDLFSYDLDNHSPSLDSSLLSTNLFYLHQKRKPSLHLPFSEQWAASTSPLLPSPDHQASASFTSPHWTKVLRFLPAPSAKAALETATHHLFLDSQWPLPSLVLTWSFCCIRRCWPSPTFRELFPGNMHLLCYLIPFLQ